ncbi:MAG: TraR/DksA C4-type zinc finger protein [Opitutales bacterium]|nr:TraR/DksA C4-type zinc finger protein [Opitutales bacterium]MCH8540250.1 TraR/DksA C4-type zinc finger protein [Opitutales bacterium]
MPKKKSATKKTAKKAIKKVAPKKSSEKKVATKKAANKKTVGKKAPVKKASAKKAATKKAAGQKAANKKAAAKKPAKKAKKTPTPKKITSKKKSATKKTVSKKNPSETARKLKEKLQSAKKPSGKSDPKPKNRPVAFSFEEAEELASQFGSAQESAKPKTKKKTTSKKAAPAKKAAAEPQPEPDFPVEKRTHEAASLADILGTGSAPKQEKPIPKKFEKYYKLLLELRDHVTAEFDLHSKDTLKRSAKEDTGDLSSYSQHMADAGTDAFDRDFALNLLSTEQEALAEIEAAIQRIHNGTYGICEITGKPINKSRLVAVPFARFSVEGQAEYEKNKRRNVQRGGGFGELTGDAAQFLADDDD